MNVREVEYLGSGRNRAVYRISRRYVLKIPLTEHGHYDNWSEARQWRQGDRSWLLRAQKAPCRLLPNGALLMLYVEPVIRSEGLPDWTGGVDCGQVGQTLDGRLLAYDYA